jgi:hypothetical protein
MAAIGADILRIPASARQEPDPVCPEKTNQRMSNRPLAICFLEEAVTTVARVLHEAVARRHRLNVVPNQPARIAHLLCEPLSIREAIVFRREHERMSAPNAYVLVDAVTIGEPHVGVVPEEAR